MKIYVINLARAVARKARMQEQAESLGLTFEFIEAIDGRYLQPSDHALVDYDRRKRFSRFPLTDNEIACYLSHLNIMRRIARDAAPVAAVLEDDAQLSLSFSYALTAIENLGPTFDLIDLHKYKNAKRFISQKPLSEKFVLGRWGYSNMQTTSYVISREGATKFLEMATPIVFPIDMAIHRYWKNGLNIYGLNIPVVQEDDGGYSYIGETRKDRMPQDRVAYEDAAHTLVAWRRRANRTTESISKRMAFWRTTIENMVS